MGSIQRVIVSLTFRMNSLRLLFDTAPYLKFYKNLLPICYWETLDRMLNMQTKLVIIVFSFV